MILRFLKFNDYRAWLYLLIFSIILGSLAAFFQVGHGNVFLNTAGSFFFQGESGVFNKLWIKIPGILLLAANVILFDYVISSQELVERNNHVPAFLMALYFSYCLQENPLHPQLFAQLLLTFSYLLFISTYRVEQAGSKIFDAAFCLSCAVILFPAYWVFFALGFICLGVLRPFNFREYALVIAGMGLPYLFYYWLLYLTNNDLHKPMQDIANSFRQPAMPVYFEGSFLVNFSTILVIFFTGLYFLTKSAPEKMKTQKALMVFIWTLLPCMGAIFITNHHSVFTGQMAVMPISLFAGIYFGNAKRRTFAEVLVLLMLVILVLSLLQHAGVWSY